MINVEEGLMGVTRVEVEVGCGGSQAAGKPGFG